MWHIDLGLLAVLKQSSKVNELALLRLQVLALLNEYESLIEIEIMSLRLAEEMIFSLRARGGANRVGLCTIPYIRVHILGVGSANARKLHRPMPERISSCTRSPSK